MLSQGEISPINFSRFSSINYCKPIGVRIFFKMKLALLLLVASAVCVLAKHEIYSGYKTYRIDPANKEQIYALNEVYDSFEADVWQGPKLTGGEGYVMIPPHQLTNFEDFLASKSIPYSIYIEDVKTSLDKDDLMYEESRSRVAPGSRHNFDTFLRYDEIVAHLQQIESENPTRITVQAGANSFQGRPIWYAKISTTNFQDTSKPVIVVEATVHAREWAAPPVALYAIDKLVRDITENDLANEIDWVIVPVGNPDGYEWSHTNARLWRKTRRPSSIFCVGTDPNRNFAFQWNAPGGASTNACNDAFRGPAPWSEPEVAFLRDLFHEHLSRTAMYISVHSFGSMLLYPWAYNGAVPANGLQLHTLGVQAATAIQRVSIPEFGTYAVGNVQSILGYLASGSSADYITSLGVDLSFVFELPGIGSGFQGFQLPPHHIRQVVFETWEGIIVLARYALANHSG